MSAPRLRCSRTPPARRSPRDPLSFATSTAYVGSWSMPDGGFFGLLHPPGTGTCWLTVEAMTETIAVVPGAGFVGDWVDHEHLRLSFNRIAEEDIVEGIARLRTVIVPAPDPSLGTDQES
jgi:DNA-binding transcriptional MocR family regulator